MLVVTLIKNIVIIFLMAIQFAMLARAIMSWFPFSQNKFTDFLYGITEPFIYPIRLLFQKMNWFTGLPIDIAFLVSYFIITIVVSILPRI